MAVRITHYLYNAFLVEAANARVVIDPGQNLWIFALKNLIPKEEWPSVTHIVITHGDPDHHWQSDRVAAASGAHVVCGVGLTKTEEGQTLVVDPRGRGLTSWVPMRNLHPLDVGQSIELEGVTIEAIRSVHGPIAVPILGFTFRQTPGPHERVGLGSTAFQITIGTKSILNLGDSLLLADWEGLKPTVLMLPIGGLDPELVIPCHYNVPFLWKRKFAVADDARFKREVEALGKECRVLGAGHVANV